MTVNKIQLGEQTQGLLPTDQIALTDGTPGYVPIDNGDGTATWGAMTGGGSPSVCEHEHRYDRFVAAGATPETFTLAGTPLWGVTVVVQGLEADPDDVTLAGSDVSVDTSGGDIVVIRYEIECGSVGALAFPGTDEMHEYGGTSTQMNVQGSVVTTGPAYLVVRGTSFNDQFIVVTDAYPTILDVEGEYTDGGGGYPQTGDVYLFRLQNAGTFYISGYVGAYDGGLTGSGTAVVHYPSGGGTALTFPGVTHVFAAQNWNNVATINVTEPTAIFVTLDADLPVGYYVEVISDDESWQFALDPTTGAPPPGGVDPIPAGTYVFLLNERDDMPGDWHILIGDGSGYDAGLTNTGEYETHTP